MGAGMYRVRVIGELDSTKIRAELARISNTPLRVNGALGGIGVSAGKAVKGVKGLNGQLIQTNKNIKKINGKNLNSVASASEKSAKGMKSFASETLGVTKKVIQFGAITAIIRGVTSGLGDMVKNVYELDGALTEFKKVSDLSGKGLEKYTDQAYKVGKTVARTGTEMIEAATEFKKSGFNEKDSLELGRVASMYQNVADVEISAGEAANFIVSQMKAFNMTAGDAEHIIDAVNKVSNNFAVSSADIATNIGKASAAMATGNVTYEQSVGLMTAMTEITRNGAKSARGLVSIQSRYNQIVDESSSTGKKLTAWYKEHNIAIKDQNGQLRSFFEVGKEVAEIWDTLDDNEKRYYLNTQAGANQSQNLAALMRNYGTAIEATDTALDSAGSAAEENARYMDSMQGKLEELASAWENFSRKIIDSDWLKKGMDVLTNVLEALSTDVGQAVIKYGLLFTGVATGLNLIAKAGMALKGLSLVKLFSGVGKEARLAGGLIGETAVQSSKLDKAFSFLLTDTAAWAIGIAGVSAAISAGLIAYDKYMQKHDAFAKSEAEDIKATKEYQKATKDLVKIQERLQGVQSEIEQLKQKRETGTLTETEKKRLDLLLEQENSLKRQAELQEKLIRHDFEKSEQKLGKSGLTSTDFSKGRGKTAQEIWADKGVYNEADKAVYLYNKSLKDTISLKNKAKKAQDDYDEALRKGNATQDELDDLEKKATQAQKAYEDSQQSTLKTLDSLYNKKQEYLDVYGDEKSIPEELKGSYKNLNKVIQDNEHLMDVSTDNINGGMKAIKKYGKSMGVIVDDANKIDQVDLANFNQSMSNAGKSADDVLTYLQEIAAENPDVTFTLDGSEYTIDQLTVVDGQLQTLDGTVVTTTLDAKDNVTPKEQKIKGHKNLGKATKMLGEKGGHKVNTTMKDLEKKKNLGKATKGISQTGGGSVERKLNTIAARKNLGTAVKKVSVTLSGISAKIKALLGLKKGIKHFAGGGVSSIFDNAEVNEQGFEIIQDSDTGLMRVVNGGKRGTTHLNRGDTVYTHGQSVRMLRQAGITEGEAVYGNGNNDFVLGGVRKLKGYAGGLNKEQYNKKYEAITKAYDNALDVLEYKRDRYRWSEKTFRKYYIKLYNKYRKKLKALNKKKVASDVKKKSSLGRERYQDYSLDTHDILADNSKESIESYIEGNLLSSTKGLKGALNKIKKSRKSKYITAKEADEYRKSAYKKHLEYNIKQYEDDKKSYKSMSSMLKKYYKKGRITAQEYYDYLDTLREKESEKSKDAIDSFINDNLLSTSKGITNAIKKINKAEKKGYLTTKEAAEYRKEAYKKHLEYSLNQYTNDKKSYKKTLAMLKSYYKKGRISAQEYYDYLEQVNEHYSDKVRDSIESFINDHLLSSNKGLTNALSKINTAQKKGNITAKEATEYRKEAYKKHLEYNIKQYQNDKKTYTATLAMLKQYHNKKILTDVEYYDYLESLQDHYNDKVKESIETYLSKYRLSSATIGLANALKMINDAEKAGNLTTKEAIAYRKEAYTKHLEYNIKQYQNDKKTFKDTLALLKQYYNDKIFTDVEYYDYLDSLASTQLGKEKDRLNTQLTTTQNTYDLAKSYVQRQIDLLEKENDEQDKQNELVELQNNLAKARNQRVRIYKEGEGFVYEQDTEAIKEATDALKDYQKSNYKNPVLEQWQAILDIFDELETNSQLKRLEQSIGGNVVDLFGGLGTDKSAWENWIKNSLSTSGGLQDVINNLDKLVDTNDILNYLDSNGQVTQSIINKAIKQNILPATYASALTQAALTNAGLVGSAIGIGTQSAIASAVGGSVINGSTSQYGNVYNFENLVLPNVTNAQQFLNELSNLSAIALQSSTSRT